MLVLCLLHCFIHVLENFPALIPGPAEFLVLRGATYPRGREEVVRAPAREVCQSLRVPGYQQPLASRQPAGMGVDMPPLPNLDLNRKDNLY